MRQPSLFGDVHPTPAAPEAAGSPPGESAPARRLEGLPDLFERPVMLQTELDAAVASGRFEDAKRCYVELVDVWSESKSTQPVAFLARLDVSVFDRPADEVLDYWVRFAGDCISNGAQLRRAWRGLVLRLRQSSSLRAVAIVRPHCVVPIVNALWEIAGSQPGALGEARELIRDALCAGHELPAGDVLDHAVRDVLSENLGPVWLASLGAIRHVWTVTAIGDGDAEELLRRWTGAGSDDPEAARMFWECLRIARSQVVRDALRHEARRRMKRLHPEIHALALGGPR